MGTENSAIDFTNPKYAVPPIDSSATVAGTMSDLLGFVTYIAWFVGVILIAAALFTYLRAKVDENAMKETSSIIMLVAGIVFIVFGAVLRFMFGA